MYILKTRYILKKMLELKQSFTLVNGRTCSVSNWRSRSTLWRLVRSSIHQPSLDQRRHNDTAGVRARMWIPGQRRLRPVMAVDTRTHIEHLASEPGAAESPRGGCCMVQEGQHRRTTTVWIRVTRSPGGLKSGCDSVDWPHRDGGSWPHFATRRAVVTKLFGPTR